LRFYQDWQTFFATRSRILAARWLSVDGNIANTLAFNAGDFRQKYSHLTLWSPDLDLLYEPLIFARMRQELMDEQYLGGNDRVLQGVNLDFARRFDGPVSEMRVDGVGSRVRRGEFLDKDGYQGFRFAKSDMDRFLLGANAEAFAASNLYLGGSYLALLDDRGSYRQNAHSPEYLAELANAGIPAPAGWSLNDQDSVVARDLRVVSGRVGADLAGFLGNPGLVLEFTAEYARSREANRYAWRFRTDTAGGAPHEVPTESDAPGKDGQALVLEMEAGYRKPDSAFSIGFSGVFLRNEAAFLNPLAQSPVFSGARIMNTENDPGSGRLYSTFDALYDGVYKFSPSSRVVGGTASYQQAPISKTSYHNGVMSPEDLARFRPDPVLQLALPFGYATANRTGPAVRVTGAWRNAVHATLDLALLQEVEGSVVDSVAAPAAAFTQMGGGVMLEADRLLGLGLPLDLQASFARSGSKRDRTAKDLADPAVTADLLMAGVHWKFLPKWGLLAGFQQAKLALATRVLEKGTGADAGSHVYQYRQDETQRHLRAGIEYALTRDAYLMLSGGLISVDRSLANRGTPENAEGPVPARDTRSDFTQTLSQAVIKVGF
jgi:hypothetical protein